MPSRVPGAPARPTRAATAAATAQQQTSDTPTTTTAASIRRTLFQTQLARRPTPPASPSSSQDTLHSRPEVQRSQSMMSASRARNTSPFGFGVGVGHARGHSYSSRMRHVPVDAFGGGDDGGEGGDTTSSDDEGFYNGRRDGMDGRRDEGGRRDGMDRRREEDGEDVLGMAMTATAAAVARGFAPRRQFPNHSPHSSFYHASAPAHSPTSSRHISAGSTRLIQRRRGQASVPPSFATQSMMAAVADEIVVRDERGDAKVLEPVDVQALLAAEADEREEGEGEIPDSRNKKEILDEDVRAAMASGKHGLHEQPEGLLDSVRIHLRERVAALADDAWMFEDGAGRRGRWASYNLGVGGVINL